MAAGCPVPHMGRTGSGPTASRRTPRQGGGKSFGSLQVQVLCRPSPDRHDTTKSISHNKLRHNSARIPFLESRAVAFARTVSAPQRSPSAMPMRTGTGAIENPDPGSSRREVSADSDYSVLKRAAGRIAATTPA